MTQDMKEVSNQALDKWSVLAVGAGEARLGAPLHVVLGEAVDLASLAEHHWSPRRDPKGNQLPGFSTIASHALINEATAQEMRELQIAVAAAHSDYLVAIQASNDAPLDRADFVLSEIRSVLEFAFDDGVHDEADDQLERLAVAFSDSAAQDATALALEGYAALGERHQVLIEELGFETALFAEARTLAAALRERSARLLTEGRSGAPRDALGLRNRLLTLLLDRVRSVRRAARYVFRQHPDVARKFTSAYERRQRAARRRKGEEEATQAAATAE